jgi:hypothetical protein
MTPRLFLDLAIRPALGLLPDKMTSPEAEAMILAICLQESRLKNRLQLGGGPARGFAQMEHGTPRSRGGVTGLFMHERTVGHVKALCEVLVVPATVQDVYEACAWNDVLTAGLARLNLYWYPAPLPLRGDSDGSWRYYLNTWNPGKPHPQTWPAFYSDAWEVVAGPEIVGMPV